MHALPIVYDHVNVAKTASKVVIISPLQSLMEDQVRYLKSVGLTAIALHDKHSEDELKKVEEGKYTYLFASPEKMLNSDRWRKLLSCDVYRKSLISVIVDEAHCISQWGSSGTSKCPSVPFRVWYSNLGELRSLIAGSVPSVVLTATACKSTKRDIFQTLNLNMKSVLVIERSPDMPNIRFDVHYLENKIPLEKTFSAIIDDVRVKRSSTTRTVIFCQTRKQCALIYNTFKESLGVYFYLKKVSNPKERLIEMYHSGTPSSVKKHIQENIGVREGHIRVLVCTIAFGMGVDMKGVCRVIHFGPSKNIENYVQECGRAGREGQQSTCLLLYNGLMSARCNPDIKDYIETDTQCRRKQIFDHFPGGFIVHENVNGHNCCDVCARNCSCGEDKCTKNEMVIETSSSSLNETVTPPLLYGGVRCVNNEQINKLRNSLNEYHKEWILKCSKGVVLLPSILFEFSHFQINQVMANCDKIKTLEHVEHFVEVWRKEHSRAILLALHHVFDDIDINEILAAESLPDDHCEFDDDIQLEWEELRDDSELNFLSESELMSIDFMFEDTQQSGIEERNVDSQLIEDLLLSEAKDTT